MTAIIWLTVILLFWGSFFFAAKRNTAKKSSNQTASKAQMWLSQLLAGLALLVLQLHHPLLQTLFIWLGLVSLMGVVWVVSHPSRR